jgi:hypothetical protein
MKPITISLRHLERAGACNDGRREFVRRFGERTLATVTIAVANADQFDWDWAAEYLLRASYQEDYQNRICAWSWEPWRDSLNRDQLIPGAHFAHNRYKAATFAKLFLAQGGMPPRRER